MQHLGCVPGAQAWHRLGTACAAVAGPRLLCSVTWGVCQGHRPGTGLAQYVPQWPGPGLLCAGLGARALESLVLSVREAVEESPALPMCAGVSTDVVWPFPHPADPQVQWGCVPPTPIRCLFWGTALSVCKESW